MLNGLWYVYRLSDGDPYGTYLGMFETAVADDVLFLGPKVAPLVSPGDILLLDGSFDSKKLRVSLDAVETKVPFAFHFIILGESAVQHNWEADREKLRKIVHPNLWEKLQKFLNL